MVADGTTGLWSGWLPGASKSTLATLALLAQVNIFFS